MSGLPEKGKWVTEADTLTRGLRFESVYAEPITPLTISTLVRVF